MFTTVTKSMFIRDMLSIRPDNFSTEGLESLYDYLEDTDVLEFDLIAICCQYSEIPEEDLVSQRVIAELSSGYFIIEE